MTRRILGVIRAYVQRLRDVPRGGAIGDSDMLASQETPEERRARMRAWLENLPPHLNQIYQNLRRIDPNGQRRR
jgi:hypothetical protein